MVLVLLCHQRLVRSIWLSRELRAGDAVRLDKAAHCASDAVMVLMVLGVEFGQMKWQGQPSLRLELAWAV